MCLQLRLVPEGPGSGDSLLSRCHCHCVELLTETCFISGLSLLPCAHEGTFLFFLLHPLQRPTLGHLSLLPYCRRTWTVPVDLPNLSEEQGGPVRALPWGALGLCSSGGILRPEQAQPGWGRWPLPLQAAQAGKLQRKRAANLFSLGFLFKTR